MDAILHITGGIYFCFSGYRTKVLIKTSKLIHISTLKCGISSLELVFMENQAIVPTFQHGFQTGFSITIYINEKFL